MMDKNLATRFDYFIGWKLQLPIARQSASAFFSWVINYIRIRFGHKLEVVEIAYIFLCFKKPNTDTNI